MILKNGLICFPGENDPFKADLKIEKGKISQIGHELKGDKVIDAKDLYVLPGGIDPHVHFNEPGFTEREDFHSGSRTAVAGGITTVVDMPCTSNPPITNMKNLKEKLAVIEKKSVVDFGLFGGVSSQSYNKSLKEEMEKLAAYVLGFKTYFISGMDSFQSLNHYQFLTVLRKAKHLKKPILLHAEDRNYVSFAEIVQRKRGSEWENYYESRPEIAEIIAVNNAVSLAKKADADLHIVHLGTAEAALCIKDFPNITGETAPHYLEFSLADLKRIGGALKTAPVVKKIANKAKLWELLKRGVIDFVASDHAPAPKRMKNTGSAWTDYSGIPGTTTLLPYIFSEGYMKRRLSLRRFLAIISENAARRYGLYNRKGSVTIGKDADLVLIDPRQNWQIKGEKFYSKGKITPFQNMLLQGRINKTIIRGEIVYDEKKGIVQSPGFGKFLKAK